MTRALHGAHSLLLQDVTVDYNDPGDPALPNARIFDGADAGEVSCTSRQAAQRQISRQAGRSGIRSPAALGGSDSDERILDLSVGRRRSPATGGKVAAARETAEEPEELLSQEMTAALLQARKDLNGDFAQVGPLLI